MAQARRSEDSTTAEWLRNLNFFVINDAATPQNTPIKIDTLLSSKNFPTICSGEFTGSKSYSSAMRSML